MVPLDLVKGRATRLTAPSTFQLFLAGTFAVSFFGGRSAKIFPSTSPGRGKRKMRFFYARAPLPLAAAAKDERADLHSGEVRRKEVDFIARDVRIKPEIFGVAEKYQCALLTTYDSSFRSQLVTSSNAIK
jgi:hypothetical protein